MLQLKARRTLGGNNRLSLAIGAGAALAAAATGTGASSTAGQRRAALLQDGGTATGVAPAAVPGSRKASTLAASEATGTVNDEEDRHSDEGPSAASSRRSSRTGAPSGAASAHSHSARSSGSGVGELIRGAFPSLVQQRAATTATGSGGGSKTRKPLQKAEGSRRLVAGPAPVGFGGVAVAEVEAASAEPSIRQGDYDVTDADEGMPEGAVTSSQQQPPSRPSQALSAAERQRLRAAWAAGEGSNRGSIDSTASGAIGQPQPAHQPQFSRTQPSASGIKSVTAAASMAMQHRCDHLLLSQFTIYMF